MTFMATYQIISIIVLLTSIFAYINDRYIKWPPTIGIMALSLMTSIAVATLGQVVPVLHSSAVKMVHSINFELVLMKIMLSFLLFAGAIRVEIKKLRVEALAVLVLATLGICISTLLVSVMTWALFGAFRLPVPYVYCALFGALISPTDPIAVIGILKQAGIPETLETKIAGEALFNDGVAVVVFLTIAEVARGGPQSVSIIDITLLLGQEAIGGLAFGALAGYLSYRILRSIDNYRVEVLITLSLVMCGYAFADYLHVSAPIAMVVIGVMLGSGQVVNSTFSTTSRDYLGKFWHLIDEIFNAILFLLVGLEMLVISIKGRVFLIGCLLIGGVLLARWLSVLVPVFLLRNRVTFEEHAVAILTWGGLRGGISVALALSLPENMHRTEFLLCTYLVVIFSIIGQGLTIGPFSRRLQLSKAA